MSAIVTDLLNRVDIALIEAQKLFPIIATTTKHGANFRHIVTVQSDSETTYVVVIGKQPDDNVTYLLIIRDDPYTQSITHIRRQCLITEFDRLVFDHIADVCTQCAITIPPVSAVPHMTTRVLALKD